MHTSYFTHNPKSPLKRLGGILSILICIGCTGGDRRQATISLSDLRSRLQPLTGLGTYAGFAPTTGVLYMGNDVIDRRMRLGKETHRMQTIRYTYKPSGQNYIDLPSEEFRFQIGDIYFSGEGDLLTYDSYQILQKIGGVKQVVIQFTYTSENEPKPSFHLWVHYEIYPNLPLIRKWMTVQNLTDSAFYLEDIAVESLSFFAARVDSLQIWPYSVPEQPEEIQPPWAGGTTAVFVFVQDPGIDGGVVLGNESPGLLKHYQVYANRDTVSIGLTPTTDANGTEIRVPPERSVNSPKVWTMLLGAVPQAAVETVIRNVVAYSLTRDEDSRSEMPEIRWAQLSPEGHVPVESPQQGNLIVFDYDWDIRHLEELKPMGQQVHENGGKLGIRLPMAEIRMAVLNRPAWRLTPVPMLFWRMAEADTRNAESSVGRQEEGKKETGKERKAEQQRVSDEADRVIYCILSDYGYYLAQAVKTLLEETAADVLIFDCPILGLPGSVLKGCKGFGHEHYTRAESIGAIYRWVFDFADYLHGEYPHLQLGLTATAYGVAHPDAACFAHFDLFFDGLSLVGMASKTKW